MKYKLRNNTQQKKILSTSNMEGISGHSSQPKPEYVSPKAKKPTPSIEAKRHLETAPTLIVTGRSPAKISSTHTPTRTRHSHVVGKQPQHSSLPKLPAIKSKENHPEDLEINEKNISNIRYFNNGIDVTQSVADHE
jgi:hypothetical protein